MGAPFPFNKREPRSLPEFFRSLEDMFLEHGINDSLEKATYLPRYVGTELREYVQGLVQAENKNYNRVKRAFLDDFGAPDQKTKYVVADLRALIAKQSIKEIVDKADARGRFVLYKTMAQNLLDKDLVTEKDVDIGYWRSLPKDVRERAGQYLKYTHA